MRQEWNYWRKRELQTLAPIYTTAPERLIGHRHVNDPLAIAREFHIVGGNSGQEGQKAVGAAIVADKFRTRKISIRKDLLAISTGNTEDELHWTRCELHGQCFPAQQTVFLPYCVDLISAEDMASEKEIAAIGSPHSATFLGWIVPG